MVLKVILGFSSFLLGILIGYIILIDIRILPNTTIDPTLFPSIPLLEKKQVIGFLPFWLTSRAKADYSSYITTLTYFGLTLDTDGTVLKYTSPQELEPGWYNLKSGKIDTFLNSAKAHHQTLSLLLFDGDQDSINSLVSNPIVHGDNVISEVKPVMQQYGFTDLNLDIESTQNSSISAQTNFTQFVSEVKKGLDNNHLGTLTIEVSPHALISSNIIDPGQIARLADYIVIMAYDYHYTGSSVTGPVSPLYGAGTISEYDTQSAVNKALALMPAQKIILGLPLYGYEWQSLGNTPRSAVIPGTGEIASNFRVENLIAD